MERYILTFPLSPRVILAAISLLAASAILLALLWLLSDTPATAAPAAELHVCPGGPPTCDYATVQAAVDAANPGDVIKVATGVYTGVQARAGITQVVYISKTVTVRGGYTTTIWTNPDPVSNPTTLDAQGLGRVLVISGSITPTLEGLRITGGDASGLGGGGTRDDAGGGVYVYTATATISGCVIYSNTASTTGNARGGGLYLQDSASILQGNTVVSNVASVEHSGEGGGLYLASSDVVFQSNTVRENIASSAFMNLDGFGGGLYLYNSNATLRGNSIISNTSNTSLDTMSNGGGGGLYLRYSNATLENNAVQGNMASARNHGEGGGLYLRYSNAMLVGNTVQGNIASADWVGEGGGLYLSHSDATLVDNTVVSNTASSADAGGGGGLSLYSSAPTLQGNTIQGNIASTADQGFGGGLFLFRADATLVGNTIQANTASSANDGSGGGLFLSRSDATIQSNIIISNTATLHPAFAGRGGGLLINCGNPFTLTNNFIANNHAMGFTTGGANGGGLLVECTSGTPTSGFLLHNTIANNQVEGVYVRQYITLTFSNTIIAGHSGVGLIVSSHSTATLEGTLWHNNERNTYGSGTILAGEVNIYDDPAFVNPATLDYHLGPDSPAIDAGISTGVKDDIDGDQRPQGTGYDIGADELPVALEVTKQAIPDLAQAGAILTYSISITNTGHLTLTATITDVLPAPITPSGSLTWTASIAALGGVWTKQFTVTVNPGYAGVLTNVVQVSTEEGATGTYTHTINTIPSVAFSSPSYDTSEGSGAVTVTLALNHASSVTATVDHASGGGTATPGEDYTVVSDTLVFTPGVTSRTFTIPIAQDGIDEYDETVILTLSNAGNVTIGGNDQTTLTIQDDDDPPMISFSSTTYSVNEDAGTVAITTTLDVLSALTITVEYTATGGTATPEEDYTIIGGTLVFTPGIVSQTMTVTIIDDGVNEGEETIILMLHNPINATIGDGTAVLTIAGKAEVYLPLVLRNW
jgi:uncharacterized repeat protein (TIGR01451 family)